MNVHLVAGKLELVYSTPHETCGNRFSVFDFTMSMIVAHANVFPVLGQPVPRRRKLAKSNLASLFSSLVSSATDLRSEVTFLAVASKGIHSVVMQGFW